MTSVIVAIAGNSWLRLARKRGDRCRERMAYAKQWVGLRMMMPHALITLAAWANSFSAFASELSAYSFDKCLFYISVSTTQGVSYYHITIDLLLFSKTIQVSFFRIKSRVILINNSYVSRPAVVFEDNVIWFIAESTPHLKCHVLEACLDLFSTVIRVQIYVDSNKNS